MVGLVFYGLLALVAGLNFLLMRRPRGVGGPGFAVLIPARNEEANLRRLLPALHEQGLRVYVFDDESTDATAQVARENHARLVQPHHTLPPDWTGKTRACHELAKAASEDFDGDWFVFLDADVQPGPMFRERMAGLLAGAGRRAPVVTGFPRLVPGRGAEPLVMQWVWWILLATNPFFLVSRTGLGHNFFTNGQVTAFRADAYWHLRPHEAVRGRILEDVAIGRLLARERVRVEVADLSGILSVAMYPGAREAVAGMTKNAAEIAGKGWWALSLFLVVAALGWVVYPPAVGLLLVSVLAAQGVTRGPLWTVPLAPIGLLVGAWVVARSALRRGGGVEWKGRTYHPDEDGLKS